VFYLGASRFSLLPYTIISTVVTLVCAMVSWHLIEKPFQVLGKKLLNCRRIAKKETTAS
jgi:peptidoglycan/LPS O-acetylase OafA/YrhL